MTSYHQYCYTLFLTYMPTARFVIPNLYIIRDVTWNRIIRDVMWKLIVCVVMYQIIRGLNSM